jgi:hemerythrin superfamily protein
MEDSLATQSDIFDRLKQDHDQQRVLFEQLAAAEGGERETLFERLTKEIKSHALAEEQALYSTMLRKPETTEETRHSVAEHKEVDDLLNDLAATDSGTSEWTDKFEHLRHRYTHHIDEEEEENFPDYARYLDEDDVIYMRSVFERRKAAERAEAEVTPEKLEEAKE